MRKSTSRAFNRDVTRRKALRKKHISDSIMCSDSWYPQLGYYRKGKIHCSCGLCMSKTRNKKYKRRHIHGNYAPSINYSIKDLKRIQLMDISEEDYQSF